VIQAAIAALEDFPKPTLALIEGPCVGGGCGLALACDLRVATANARFAITPAKLGLVYGLEDVRRLVQAVGVSAAKDMLFSGRLLDAGEALATGLVDRVVADGDLDQAADTLAAPMLAASSWSQQAQKAVFALLRGGGGQARQRSDALFGDAFAGADFAEGFAAFMEKRRPRFGGSG
jgi:enoyl-CoA hydratase/carnithine racemase